MCEANAYLYEDGREVLVLESVDEVVPTATHVFLRNIFDQRRMVAGRIKELRLVDHRVVLERFPK